MTQPPTLLALRAELDSELRERILPFWIEHTVDERNGGFVGLVTADGVAHPDAPKAVVLNTRILWTFSAAARVLGSRACLAAARRAVEYFCRHFVDAEHGGVYWMLDADGTPIDERKHVYAQAFAVYALSEHFRATHDERSLQLAIGLFELIERYAHDPAAGGYREAFTRDWGPLDDVRLSDVDDDAPRSMNTHLHVLEAYTGLLRVWPDPVLRQRLREVIRLFLDVIVDAETARGRCFFDADWTPLSGVVSYGHDIETSWLLLEAAEAAGEDALLARARRVSVAMAAAVLESGFDPAGGLFNEGGPHGAVDTDKEWWPQAEAIVGFVNAYQQSGDPAFLDAACATWAFTRDHFLDREHGEWLRRVARDGTPRPGHEKVGPWKCPYHNARACLEIIARVAAPAKALATAAAPT